MSELTQDDFIAVKYIALSAMETAESMMDECTKRADRIKELEAECDTIDKACVRLATKNILLGNGLLRNEAEIERLRAKISDIEGREDLVTTELEHRASVAEDKLRVVEEMRDELLEDWEKKRGEVARLKTIVNELEADEVCLNSSIKAFRAVIGEKDLRIADMESQREMVRKMHNRREAELLEIIDDLTTENKRLEAYHDHVRDTHQAREVEFSKMGERYGIDLELLDDMLNLVNPLIKSGAYARPSTESIQLATQMHGLCQTVVQYRRKHGIVG